MFWYTFSVWQTVDRYFRDQFREYLEKEYEENVEIKKDVMMEAQREAARKALIEKMAKIEFNKALDRQAEMAKKKHQQRFGRTEGARSVEEKLTENQSAQEEEGEVCSDEGDRGGTCGTGITQEGVTMVSEEGMVLLNDGFDPMSQTEVGTFENEGGWAMGPEVSVGREGAVSEDTFVEGESSIGTEDYGRNWETERIIAEMQSELETESNFDVWNSEGGCDSEPTVQEECRLEDFARVEDGEEVDKKWRSAFNEDEGEMCLIDSAENRGSCSHDVKIEGEGVFIKRPFGN